MNFSVYKIPSNRFLGVVSLTAIANAFGRVQNIGRTEQFIMVCDSTCAIYVLITFNRGAKILEAHGLVYHKMFYSLFTSSFI